MQHQTQTSYYSSIEAITLVKLLFKNLLTTGHHFVPDDEELRSAITHNVIMNVLDAKYEGKEIGNAIAYAKKSFANEYFQHCRKHNARRKYNHFLNEDENELSEYSVFSGLSDIDHKKYQEELLNEIDNVVRKCSSAQQEVFYLRQKGMSYKEIAQQFEKMTSTHAKANYHEVIAKLRKWFNKQ